MDEEEQAEWRERGADVTVGLRWAGGFLFVAGDDQSLFKAEQMIRMAADSQGAKISESSWEILTNNVDFDGPSLLWAEGLGI